jgi:hypothetical protein
MYKPAISLENKLYNTKLEKPGAKPDNYTPRDPMKLIL